MKNLILTILFILPYITCSAFDDMDYTRKVACLTGDSLITLANGSQKQIRDIHTGDEVFNNRGEIVIVLKVVAGPEKKPVYKIEFESGRSIIATEKHPFKSISNLFITSEEIKVGQVLKGESRDEVVTKVSTHMHTGNVYNLVLVSEKLFLNADRNTTVVLNKITHDWRSVLRKQNPFLGLTDQSHSYFANGIESGDLVIQVGLLK